MAGCTDDDNAINQSSLLCSMLPLGSDCVISSSLMTTHFFSNSNSWRSLVIVGQNQVQRNGLLFQAALTYASSGKQITYIMKREFTRFPPTTHEFPTMGTENMANITFKYCQEVNNITELLSSYCSVTTDLLPDVLVISGLNEYFKESVKPVSEYQLSKIFSLLTETVEYIGRRKSSTILLFVSLALTARSDADDQPSWETLLRKWVHEVWTLEGNSNRLVCRDIQVQFTVLGSNIYLKSVSRAAADEQIKT